VNLLHKVNLVSLFLLLGSNPIVGLPGAETFPPKTNSVNTQVLKDSEELTRLTVAVTEFSIQDVELETGNFDLISINQEQTISKEGWPDLPYLSKCVIIPPRSGVRIEINNVVSHTRNGINPVIAPRENEGVFEHSGEAVNFRESNGFWPPSEVEIGEPVVIRGYRMVNIHCYPVQYNRSTGETRFIEEIDFNLVYEGDGTNQTISSTPLKSSVYFHRLLENLVENPPPRPERDDLHCASYLYIAPEIEGLPEAIDPLIEWQRRKGHRVGVEYLENRANTGEVLDVIRDYYNSDDPVEFVTLIGDANGDIALSASSEVGDMTYTRLDGNDWVSDIALGRLSCRNLAELNRIVHKLVSYESDPYMESTDWFKQGSVVAGHIGNGLGTVLLAKYVRREWLKADYNEVRHWYHNVDGEIRGEQPFVTDSFSWGISAFHYRAYLGMNNLRTNIIYNLPNTRGRWPAVIAISCATGDFVRTDTHSEAFLKSRGGGIGAIGTATGGTNVKYNNIMAGGFWKGIYKDKLFTMGWGLNSGRIELWKSYMGIDNTYERYTDRNNLMGDPGIVLWTDIPTIIAVEHPENVQIGNNRVELTVSDEDEAPVEAALVCLYKTDDEIQITKYADNNGHVDFFINPDELSEGELLVTVSKHNHKPYLGSIDIVRPDDFIGFISWEIDDDGEGQSSGDGDGIVNPNEVIEITAQFTNFGGENPEGNVNIVFESLSQYAQVISDPVELEAVPEPGDSDVTSLVVEINPVCRNQTIILISAVLSVGDIEYQSLIRFEVVAPCPQFEGLELEGDIFNLGEIERFNIGIRNVGNKILQPSTATLISESGQIRIMDSTVEYAAVDEGEVCIGEGDSFSAISNLLTIPGTVAVLDLILETENGYIDTVSFEIDLGVKREGDPLGPDSYGYVCFDSRDEDWELAPVYNWTEIDPEEDNFEFRGIVLDLPDRGDNQDVSEVIDLPFDFQYYGEVFDQLTICSNGWAAFGDQSELADFRNRRIGQANGPDAQLCVWWDNLVFPNEDSAILFYFDEDEMRLIVEWNCARRLVGRNAYGAYETFQIILYDPETYPTQTGDGIVLFQYKNVENEGWEGPSGHPYCTIGISNLDDSDGIEYTYWNRYPVGAQRIQNRMSLLFMPESGNYSGTLTGRVADFETNEPIANAQILTSNNYGAETDENGVYWIDYMHVDEDYQISASILGWNDSTLTDFEIVEDETLEVDFSLLHPEFTPSVNEFNQILEPGDACEIDFNITNDGNGTLIWSVEGALRGDNNIDPWDLRIQYQVGDSLGDSRIQGCAFVNERIIVVGSNDRSPQVYVLNREGALIDQFDQPGVDGGYGMRDLAFDGEWIWGSVGDRVYAFTLDGQLRVEVEGPWNPTYNITWDSERELLWMSTATADIVGVDRDGNQIERLNRMGLRMYGLAYFPDDPDEHDLYIFNRVRDLGNQCVHKMNTETNDVLFVASLEPEAGGAAVGAFISMEYDILNWVFMAMVSNISSDRIDIYQLCTRRDWMRIEPEMGTLNALERQDLILYFDSSNLPVMVFEGDLVFRHNAENGETLLPVRLEIEGEEGELADRTLAMHEGWNLVSLNIIPEERNIVLFMQPLVEREVLELMKDGDGRFYLPGMEFNNIPEWEPLNGYQIKLTEAVEFNVSGEVVAADSSIPLSEGWNMKAYLPREPVNSEIALSAIVEQLIMAKDGDGRFYLPAFEFNNMGNMREGQGYQLKVSEDVELVYTFGEVLATEQPDYENLKHFSIPAPKIENMSVLVFGDIGTDNNVPADWELAVFGGDNLLLGSGLFNNNGHCGIAVWGDDPTTKVVDGAVKGTKLKFRLWNGETEIEVNVETISGEAAWTTDGLFIGKLNEKSLMPLEFGINAAYPNPFNSQVLISYSIVESGLIIIRILDITGREVATLGNQILPSGIYSTIWEAGQMPSGLYFARLESPDMVDRVKLMLVK